MGNPTKKTHSWLTATSYSRYRPTERPKAITMWKNWRIKVCWFSLSIRYHQLINIVSQARWPPGVKCQHLPVRHWHLHRHPVRPHRRSPPRRHGLHTYTKSRPKRCLYKKKGVRAFLIFEQKEILTYLYRARRRRRRHLSRVGRLKDQVFHHRKIHIVPSSVLDAEYRGKVHYEQFFLLTTVARQYYLLTTADEYEHVYYEQFFYLPTLLIPINLNVVHTSAFEKYALIWYWFEI